MSPAEVTRRLQKEMVCRRPTVAELRRRTPIAITARDQELLTDVYEHGFLTAELIELAHFPDGSHPRTTRSSCCAGRLQGLWLWNYLDRIEPPIARVFGGRRPYLYTLGRRGVPYVQARVGADGPPVQTRRLGRLHDLFIDHDLHAARLWACLKAAVRGSRLVGLEWHAERALRARKLSVKDPDSGRRLPVLPDALFGLWYPDGTVQPAAVEIDMGTVELWRFRRKIRAIELFAAQGGFAEHFGLPEVGVWVFAPSAERLDHLRRATRAEVPGGRGHQYLFATFEALTPAIARGSWPDLDGHRLPALADDAFAAPRDGASTSPEVQR